MAPLSGPLDYVLFDLVTGDFLGHLPLSGCNFSSQLNQPGQLSGTIDLSSAAAQNLTPLLVTAPGRTCLCVDYLGTLIWGGVIWPRSWSFDNTSHVLTVSASELLSYFTQRVQATDYSAPPYSGITGPHTKMAIWDASDTDAISVYDPLLIAWQLIYDALNAGPTVDGNVASDLLGGLGIAANGYTSTSSYLASSTNTPQTDYINQTYPHSSPQQMSTMLSQLAALGYGVGFDIGVDVAYSGLPFSPPAATVNLSYPRRGRSVSASQIVLNTGSALSYTIPEDGTQTGNTFYEQGSSGSLVISQNLTPIIQGYPVLEQLASRSQIQSGNILTVLSGLGLTDLYTRSYPTVTASLTFDFFNSPVAPNAFTVGDDVRWIVPTTDGNAVVFDPRLPAGLDQTWRIVGWSASIQDSGTSTLEFNLALPPGLQAMSVQI